MENEYLVDASALYPLLVKLRERLFKHLHMLRIPNLTVYEVGNAIVKEYRDGRIRDLVSVSRLFEEIFRDINVIEVSKEPLNVVELAAKDNLTFHDAYYLHVAEKMNLKLITEDKALFKYSISINVDKFIKELGY